MNKPTLPNDWMRKALDAGASALRAVNDGHALPTDDLLAGAMAIEMLTSNGRYVSPFDLFDILHRVRAFLNAQTFAALPEGRAEAARLLPMLEAIRADH
jgi:hypothetical protein